MITRLSRNSILFSTCAACWLFLTCAASTAEPDVAKKRASVEARLKKLDPFFKQHVVVGGTMVASSEKVSRWALEEVAYLMRHMLANRPDVLNGYTRLLTVLAYTEMQSALPACRGMNAWWDYRARGLAGRTISCGEENVLCLKGDPWAGENIFVHEFGHGLNSAFGGMDKEFQKRLNALHAKAKKSGLFRGYGIRNASEFWAEGVQAWFNCNGATRPKSGGGQSSLERIGPKGEHVIHIRRREHVKKHLPGLAKLLDESFRQNKWTYTPVSKRLHEPHLKGFDPAKAPTFRWPEGLAEKFQAYEEQKKIHAEMPWARVSIEQILAAKALGAPVAFESSTGIRFVLIPPGEFMMGSKDPADRAAQLCDQPKMFGGEHPRHKVTLTKAFHMSVHEGTQKHYVTITRPKGDKNASRKYPDGLKGDNMPAGKLSPPISPPSGTAQRLFQEPPAKSNFLVVTVPRTVDLATMPIYVRAGAIVPLDPIRQHTSQVVDQPTTLKIYQGADGQTTLYDDDGISLDYLKGSSVETLLRWDDAAKRLTIEPQIKDSPERTFNIELIPDGTTKEIRYAGQRLEVSL